MIPMSAYYSLLYKSGYFQTKEFSIAEYGYLASVTALRLCEVVSNFKEVDTEDVLKKVINSQLVYSLGDLSSPLVSQIITVSDAQVLKSIETLLKSRYDNVSDELIDNIAMEDNIESSIASLSFITTMFYFVARTDESVEYEYDIVISALLQEAVRIFEKFDFAELNWIITVPEVGEVYNIISAVSKKDETVN